jgi:nucleoside-diphosphate-sugar epimerase
VFHLAAFGARPGQANAPQAVTANVAMAANLAGTAAPGTVVVMAGTMAEYGRAGVLGEADACTPDTAYAIGKYVAGTYATEYGPKRGVTVRVARIFGAYGPGEHPDRLFPSLVRELSAGRPIPLSDGTQRRDFIHVGDIVEGLMRLAGLSSLDSFVVNLGTGHAVGVADVCTWVADALGADRSLLRFGERERSPGDADLLQADTARLASLLDWVPPQRLRPGMDAGLLV